MNSSAVDYAGAELHVGQWATVVNAPEVLTVFQLDESRTRHIGRRFKIKEVYWAKNFAVPGWFANCEEIDSCAYTQWPVRMLLGKYGGLRELVRRYRSGI